MSGRWLSWVLGAAIAALPMRAAALNLSAQQDPVQAAFTSQPDAFQPLCETQHRLQIRRGEETLVDERLDVEIGICRSHEDGLKVLDLDGDREPEVVLDLFSGGAHCCGFSQIYRYDAAANQYAPTIHFWGHTDRSFLEDLDGDGLPEFLSSDARFAYRFSSFAGSGMPLQVWQYRQGSLIDVTRSFPDRVYDNAYFYWQAYVTARSEGGEVKGLLAAYLANKYRLGQAEDGWQRVQQAYQESDRQQFFTQLLTFLQETGYAAPSAQAAAAGSIPPATSAAALSAAPRGNWQPVPGTANADDRDRSPWYVRLDTLTRSGDAINFDVNAYREFVRYSANCRTRQMSRIQQGRIDRDGNITAERTQEPFFPADNSPQRRLVLNFACAQPSR